MLLIVVDFADSRERLHPTGGYYFLLASAVGMENLAEVEPMTRDTLVLLETDFPDTCDQAPEELVHSAESWTLVDRFCFFSGGPINIEEDVYYQAELDGDVIFMLAFLSPSLTPEELYKLQDPNPLSEAAVDEVESVYDLTPRDFDDLRLYHLGPCRELYVVVFALLSIMLMYELVFLPQTLLSSSARGLDQSIAATLFGSP